MSDKLIRMYLLFLVVLCVTFLAAGCVKTIEIKGLRPTGEVQITVDACDIKGDISTMLTGVNMAYGYDKD